MDAVGDTKDWTWVLQRPCPDCGAEVSTISRRNVPRIIQDLGARWVELLAPENAVRERPAPGVWSTLEYGCHVRDVFRIFDGRLILMLSEDNPRFPNWNQDETAVAERYGEQDPLTVAAELRDAAARFATRFVGLSDEQWGRTGIRSDGAHFTVESFARYLLHDPIHHLYDVTGQRWDESNDHNGP